ncbi:MAG: low specificity L-threonine aldolase [Steroidobacteraceae bacterium]
MSRNFTSDNVTPACASIMQAVVESNTDLLSSYGADPYTVRLQQVASDVFETAVTIFPVTTGTAANALALAQLTPPYGGVYCYEGAHIVTDECGAPEFFTGGAKLLGLPAPDGKIMGAQLSAAIAHANELGVHHVKPAAVSLTQATEWGTVYDLAQLGEIAAVAREHRLPVHMDGARFANALCKLGVSPAAATWKAGIDVLSLGATKNGALCAEAVVFFNPALAENFERRRKQGGHLWSKLRFLSAQLLAYFRDDLWLVNARQANATAARLAQGLKAVPGARLLQAVEANEVFAALPEPTVRRLEREGFGFYRWPVSGLEQGIAIRLVTSYATTSADVEAFVAAAAR